MSPPLPPTNAEWRLPARPPHLNSTEVHIWRASLDASTSLVADLKRFLAPDEQARAERFHFQKHHDQFVVARGGLRAILSGYLGYAPQDLLFNYTPYGKPVLAAFPNLHFNVSHSGQLALYAVTNVGAIGIDLEQLRPVDDLLQVARHFFSAYENAVLEELPPALQTEAFFNCWTRKEAYLKGLGLGLSLALDQFDVSLRPGEPARLLQVRHTLVGANDWSLHALQPAPDYIATLALSGGNRPLAQFHWTPALL